MVSDIPELDGKEHALLAALRGWGRVMVAFSGGVDSTYLLDMAFGALGMAAIAVTADSPSLARSSLAEAEQFCQSKGIRHLVVKTDEFEHDEYLANDGQRCFHCKAALMRAMNGLVLATNTSRGGICLLLGVITEDLKDYRPGMVAAQAAGARWPLADAGFSKQDVRDRSRLRGLASWNRPAEPCLSSRIPYGEPVSVAGLAMIEAAENVLKRLGFNECRARHHQVAGGRGYLCRIEIPVAACALVLEHRAELVACLRAIGYLHVTLDLGGLASGGFNMLLPSPLRTIE
jgi:uncharacterized protein